MKTKAPQFQLIHDWRWVLTKAWSMRLMGASAVLSGTEVAMQFLAPRWPSGRFALAAGLVSVVAAGVRLLAQRESQ